MHLKFYGGLNQIGGNKILLEDKGTKIFFDFGMNFSENSKFFEEFLKPRACNGFGDLMELGILPKLDGIYRQDLLEISGMKTHKDVEFDAIFASHVHFDHIANVSYVDERIPIYCSELTLNTVKALQETSPRSLETEIYGYKPRPIERGSEAIVRDWRPVKTGKKFKVGSLEILPLAVDHSVAGGISYLVFGSEGSTLYTGDIRVHGTQGRLTTDMAETSGKQKVDAMVCEGTRIDEVDAQSEEFVRENAGKVVKKAKGLVVVDYAFKDMTRFTTFYNIAKATGRKLAISLKDAYLIRELGKYMKLPSIKDSNILLYLEKAGKGNYDDKDYPIWKREFLGNPNIVTAEDVHRRQKEILIRLNFFEINELIDIMPSSGSQYIHSASEAFNEEMAIDEKRLNNWLEHFGLPKHQIHASGHASGLELKEIVGKIKPKRLYPVHTEKPKKFADMFGKVTKVEMAAIE